MIASFKHRGLKALYEGRTSRRVAPEHVRKLLDILAVLDRARGPRDVDMPGLRLHPLKGEHRGHCAVIVSGNWRVTFRFEDGDAADVNYLDYRCELPGLPLRKQPSWQCAIPPIPAA